MNIRYFYAKIGTGNYLAADYLKGNTEIGKPAIPLYFDGTHDDEQGFLAEWRVGKQGKDFFWCSRPDNWKYAYIIIIYDGEIVIVRPCGAVKYEQSQFAKNKDGNRWDGIVKLLPIETVAKVTALCNVPAVLATMTSNRHYSSGSFREITDPGCRRALEMVVFKKLLSPGVRHAKNIFACMSSIEIETLVAKLFEEQGCFVPAYRGGATKGVDVFAHNDSSKPVTVGKIIIDGNSSAAIQVKRDDQDYCLQKGCHHLISGDRDAVELLQAINRSPVTLRWVKRSLDWLPADYLANNGLG